MHFKYAAILNIVFVTFTFGFGIPILYPIAAMALLILYLVEKTMLYYAYRLPPMYDERLSNSVLDMMSYAPLFLLSFGYWMASNKQILSNENLEPKERMTDPDITNHTMRGFFTGDVFSAPAWPLMMLFCFLVLNQIFGKRMFSYLVMLFPDLEIGDLELDEDIDNYWAALDDKDRDWA